MNRVSLKAVALSFLLVLFLDLVVGTCLLVFYGGEIFTQNLSDEQVSQALHAVTASFRFLMASFVLGSLTTVAGGYAVARMAKNFPYFNGLALGVLGALFGLTFWSSYPAWFNVVALVITIPATLLGTRIAVRQRNARA